MIDFLHNIQTYILQQYRQAAANPKLHRFLHQQGFTQEMIDNLVNLSLDAEQVLIRSHPFKIAVSQSLLAMHLSGLAVRKEREEIAIKALKLGASRRMLGDLLEISDNDYKRLKALAKVPAQHRNRPRAISIDIYNDLSNLHANLIRGYQRQGVEPHPLQILISMAEATDIELNQIYDSYFRNNRELFQSKDRRVGADAI